MDQLSFDDSSIVSYNPHTLQSLVQKRYVLVSIVMMFYCFLNTFFVFSGGWLLVMLNVINLLGAVCLYSDLPGDVNFNNRGIKIYVAGYVKGALVFILYIYTLYITMGFDPASENPDKTVLFLYKIKKLIVVSFVFDVLYAVVGNFVIKITREIVSILEDKDANSFILQHKDHLKLLDLEMNLIRN